MTLPHDDVGSGPPLILLHAGIADRTMWAEHLQPLANAGFRVLAADLPGFGDAPVAAQEDAPWNDVLATMDALGIDRAALVGNSLGGLVAQRVTVLAPGRVEALALVSSGASGIPPSPALQAAWEAEEAAVEDGDIEAAVAAVVRAWTLPDAPETLRTRVGAMQRRAFELQAAAETAPEGSDPLAENLEALSGAHVPALLLVGEHDMSDFHEAAVALAGALPDSRSATLLGAGHLAPLEQPALFRRLLFDFLGA